MSDENPYEPPGDFASKKIAANATRLLAASVLILASIVGSGFAELAIATSGKRESWTMFPSMFLFLLGIVCFVFEYLRSFRR